MPVSKRRRPEFDDEVAVMWKNNFTREQREMLLTFKYMAAHVSLDALAEYHEYAKENGFADDCD